MYDCLIIGGGLAGLTCGIKCAKEGLRTAIISGGINSLHFSSGSIDLMGYSADKNIIHNPFKHIKSIKRKNPQHPYAKIPVKTIEESITFLTDELKSEKLLFYNNSGKNHFRITAIGATKPTYLSQESVFNEQLDLALKNNTRISILNFEGFRDYYQEFAFSNLKKNSLFNKLNISSGSIKLSFLPDTKKHLLESNSIDIARLFETEKYLPRISEEIKKAAGDSTIITLPAFIGLNNYNKIHKRLLELTGLQIYEIPTLPPSILGMRIDNALKSRFSSLGGEFIAGDKAAGGEIYNHRVTHIYTENYTEATHHAKYYVLSTGSFLSGGLQSGFNKMYEPVFNLQFNWSRKRNKWYSDNFFSAESHPFLSFGVNTNAALHPYDKDGNVIDNLYCIGAVLSDYDPVREASGGGVAVSTACYAAQKIINGIKG
ncbi:MAG: glycerol-3-phosphate dehydrogenase subunit GlpB [Spirochaetes bacterium]|nr:glycerol-3-phosphate dehydrogenase subunit GlpB [Spirochaetota bacterium]